MLDIDVCGFAFIKGGLNVEIFLIAGIIGLLISGISIGAWTDGRQYRANFQSETAEERHFRTKIAMISGLVGMVFLGVAGLIYLL